MNALEGAEMLKNRRGSAGRLGPVALIFIAAFESRTSDMPAKKPYWLKNFSEWSRTFLVNNGVPDTSCKSWETEPVSRSFMWAAKRRESSVCAIVALGVVGTGVGVLEDREAGPKGV